MKTQMGTARSASVTDSTTIEVMLSPQQLKILAQGTKADTSQQHRSRLLIGAAVAVVSILLGSVAHLAAKQKPVAPPVVQSTPLPPAPLSVEDPVPVGEPVLYKNPFDRTEVFEFPAGTTQAEARDAVAKLLMERAQGRGPDVLKLHIRRIVHKPAH